MRLVSYYLDQNQFTLTLKNVGTTNITVGTSFTIEVSGNPTAPETLTRVYCTAPTVDVGGKLTNAWAVSLSPPTDASCLGGEGEVSAFKYTGPSIPSQLLPGQELQFSVNLGVTPDFFMPGDYYTITIVGAGLTITQPTGTG